MPNTFKDVPQPGDILSQSQSDLEHNFLYLQGALGKDHQIVIGDTDTGTTFEGRHLAVSLNNKGTSPAFPGDGTDSFFWSNTGDLWGRNATSPPLQLTNLNFSAQAMAPSTATGYANLTGGVSVQWGTITTAVNQADTAVTYAALGGKTFNAITWGVWTNIQRAGSNNVDTVYTFSYTAAGFSYHNTSASQKIFNWIAIGS
jgi:hypothetical protein